MIEIVIKIPEDEYNIAKYGQYGNINVDIVRKALANGTPLKEWLESFNTESASVCFNKIQELKGIVGAGSEKNTQGVYDGHITS